MSEDRHDDEIQSRHTPDKELISFITVVGILGFTAGMIWYNFTNDKEKKNRKRLFKRMKRYHVNTLKEYI